MIILIGILIASSGRVSEANEAARISVQDVSRVKRAIESCPAAQAYQADSKALVASVEKQSGLKLACLCPRTAAPANAQKYEPLKSVVDRAALSQFVDLVVDQSEMNAVDTLRYLTKRYGLRDVSVDEYLNQVCASGRCSEATKKAIQERFAQALDVQPLSSNQRTRIQNSLDLHIRQANNKLENLKAEYTTNFGAGYVLDYLKSPVESEKLKQRFDETYLKEYGRAVASEDGFLLLSPYAIKKIGGVRAIDSEFMNYIKKKGKFEFVPHDRVSSDPNFLNQSAKSLVGRLIEETRSLRELSNENNTSRAGLTGSGNEFQYSQTERSLRHLALLVKSNPLAVAQILLKNPGLEPYVCQIFESMKSMDQKMLLAKNVFVAGGLVAAGTVGVSLVAAVAQGAVGGSAAALATITSFAPALNASATIGTVAGAGGAILAEKTYQDSDRAVSAREGALASGNAPAESVVGLSSDIATRNQSGRSVKYWVADTAFNSVIGKILTSEKTISTADTLIQKLASASKKAKGVELDRIEGLVSLLKIGERSKDLQAGLKRLGNIIEQMDPKSMEHYLEIFGQINPNVREQLMLSFAKYANAGQEQRIRLWLKMLDEAARNCK